MCRRLRDLKKRDQGQHTRRKITTCSVVYTCFVCVEILKTYDNNKNKKEVETCLVQERIWTRLGGYWILFRLVKQQQFDKEKKGTLVFWFWFESKTVERQTKEFESLHGNLKSIWKGKNNETGEKQKSEGNMWTNLTNETREYISYSIQ